MDLRQVTEEQLQKWNSYLAPSGRNRMERYRDVRPHLCGEGLAREMLAQKLGKAPQNIVITRNSNGKPLTDGAFFSISHSGDMVLCAVSERPVGVDVECLRPVPARMADRFGMQEPGAFFRMWTRMEARIKCCGGTIGRLREFMEPLADCREDEIVAPEGYAAAVCEKMK